jgi:hypothetical protein
MNTACSLAWRFLLVIAIVANPLLGLGGSVHAQAPGLSEAPPCHEMQNPPCHDNGCPDSMCGAACEMGACVGHCVYLLAAIALPVWRGSDAQLAPRLARDARPPLLARLIRPPIA